MTDDTLYCFHADSNPTFIHQILFALFLRVRYSDSTCHGMLWTFTFVFLVLHWNLQTFKGYLGENQTQEKRVLSSAWSIWLSSREFSHICGFLKRSACIAVLWQKMAIYSLTRAFWLDRHTHTHQKKRGMNTLKFILRPKKWDKVVTLFNFI